MKTTIIELLLEWWTGITTTRMPLPTLYTYDVEVDGRIITIESMSRNRMYVHYKARKKYPNAEYIRVVSRKKQY